VCLARNFGKEAATSAGLHYAHGDAVIILDGDGQHPPALIPDMIAAWRAGAQHVVGIRTSNRRAGLIKRMGSKTYYWLTKRLGAPSVIANATDFRLIDRELVDVFKLYREKKRMTRALLDWSGFTTTYIKFEARNREFGTAGYNFKSLLRLAVNGYIGATLKPLYLVGALGLIVTAIAGLLIVVFGLNQYVFGDPMNLGVTGTAIIALFVTFLVGTLMTCQGIVAIYVANIHLEAQDRPLYIINKAKSHF
jgi:glycosyltransferase involved in cell wall biosynthesis